MRMQGNKKYLIIGIALVVLTLFFWEGIIKRYSIRKNGETISVKIVDKIINHNRTASYNLFFYYNGKLFSKEVGAQQYVGSKIGETIQLKTNKESEYFLLEKEKPPKELVYNLILMIVGLMLIRIGIQRE